MSVAKIKLKIPEGIAKLLTSQAHSRIQIKIFQDQKGKPRNQDQKILEDTFKADIVFNKCSLNLLKLA